MKGHWNNQELAGRISVYCSNDKAHVPLSLFTDLLATGFASGWPRFDTRMLSVIISMLSDSS